MVVNLDKLDKLGKETFPAQLKNGVQLSMSIARYAKLKHGLHMKPGRCIKN